MPTIIDSLVVLMGLDASDYKRGRKEIDAVDEKSDKKRDTVNKRSDKEAAERARRNKANSLDQKKYTDETIESFARLGKTIAGAFLGFESIEGGLKYLGGINATQAALGRAGTRIGATAEELNVYGKAVEYAGGKTEDALATFQKLANEKVGKDLRGEVGPLLQLLQRFGVPYEDANDKLLDMGKILDNLSAKTTNMSNQQRASLFADVGISEGVINRLLETQALQDEQLKRAAAFNNVNALAVKQAEDMASAWKQVGDATERAGANLLTIVRPTTTSALKVIADYLGGASDATKHTNAMELFGARTSDERAATAHEKYNNYALSNGGSASGRVPAPGTMAARNNNPGNIEDSKGNEIHYATLAEGEAALENDLRIKIQKHNMRTVAAIIDGFEGHDTKRNDIPAYIAAVQKQLGKNDIGEGDIKALAQAITMHESPTVPNGATPGLAGGGGGGGNTSNSTTTVHAPITVTSNSADPSAVANQTVGALNRKISVAQANAGQQ
jgi:hypothetical protein